MNKTTRNSRRNKTVTYLIAINEKQIRVCRELFLRETPDRLRYHRENKRHSQGCATRDGRGQYGNSGRKIVDKENNIIRKRI